jgi:putative endopeptidase
LLAGLLAAYDAYRASLGGRPAPVRNGFTGDQQFFLGFAQSWVSKTSDALLREQVMTDTRAPERFRGRHSA